MPYKLKKNRIIIFGKNVRAEQFGNNLKENAFDKWHICGGDLDTVCQKMGADKHDIWVLAFQNARSHKKFAARLYDKGINRVIFLPTDEAVHWEKGIRIRQIYNYLLYGEVYEDLQIPFYDEIVKKPIDTSNAIISEECGLTTFYARIETVFVNNAYKKYDKCGYAISLPLVKHYRSMFEKLAGMDTEKSAYEEYCQEQGYTKENYQERIIDRYQLYQLFKKNINRGEFFSASASLVEPNRNGVLHIKEGLHRAVFLALQGWSYIPVTICTNDFWKIYSEEKLEKLQKFFKKNHIEKTVTPISHPAFYNFPAEKEILEPSVLTAVKKFWDIGGFAGKRILDMSDYNSYFARNIGRVLWDCDDAVIESWETDELKFQLAVLYNNLLNIQNVKVEYKPSLEFCSNYDIVFIMGKIKVDDANIGFLTSLNRHVQDAVVFECNVEDCEEQIHFFTINTNFNECIHLYQFFNGIKMRKVLIFKKNKK